MEQEPVSVSNLIRKDPRWRTVTRRALERIITGPLVSQIRQELADLRSDIDVGKDNSASSLTRVGIGYYLLGQQQKAVDYLSKVQKSGAARYYYALCLMSLERFAEAEEQFQRAGELGYDPVQCQLMRAGAIRLQGRPDDAEAVMKKIAKEAAGRAEYSYQMGCIWSDRGDTYRAIEYFERAVDMDPHHSRALFRLAAENSNRGNDEEAIRLYEQSLSRPPFYIGSLLNLGLLYEDRENYPAAAFCFRKVLESNPLHQRARLYLRDIEATSDMYYDEETARQQARLEQLLSRPVTDFELSVRSRNCLEGMNIRTLGDLTRVSEQDLLAGKNFGETSLHEIREMMTAHGLMIGQNLRPTATTRTTATCNRAPVAAGAGDAVAADLRSQPVGACAEVHEPAGHHDHRRTGAAHAGRTAFQPELRRDVAERSPREAGRNTISNCATTDRVNETFSLSRDSKALRRGALHQCRLSLRERVPIGTMGSELVHRVLSRSERRRSAPLAAVRRSLGEAASGDGFVIRLAFRHPRSETPAGHRLPLGLQDDFVVAGPQQRTAGRERERDVAERRLQRPRVSLQFPANVVPQNPFQLQWLLSRECRSDHHVHRRSARKPLVRAEHLQISQPAPDFHAMKIVLRPRRR